MTPVPGRQGQKDYKFTASLRYTARFLSPNKIEQTRKEPEANRKFRD